MPKTKASHKQQMSFRQVDLHKLVARRRELEASLGGVEGKRFRLKTAEKTQRERASYESEEIVLERHRLIQELSREVKAEGAELDRLNSRIRARKSPRGVVGDTERLAERRRK